MRLTDEARRDAALVASLDVAYRGGEDGRVGAVALDSIATARLIQELPSIERREGERSHSVSGWVRAGVLPGDVLARFERAMQERGFVPPDGYRFEFGGAGTERDEAVGLLLSSAPTLVVLMMGALLLATGSFLLTCIISLVGGAAAGLGLGALWLFGYPFGFMAILGVLGLIGVAINDAIVVLAALRGDEGARRGERDAIVRVVFHATRHVMTTTATTIAGFLPLWLAGGGFWPPLAVAIAGGVAGATLLALTLVPILFSVVAPRVFRPRVESESAAWYVSPGSA